MQHSLTAVTQAHSARRALAAASAPRPLPPTHSAAVAGEAALALIPVVSYRIAQALFAFAFALLGGQQMEKVQLHMRCLTNFLYRLRQFHQLGRWSFRKQTR